MRPPVQAAGVIICEGSGEGVFRIPGEAVGNRGCVGAGVDVGVCCGVGINV